MDARLQSAFAALVGEKNVLTSVQDTAPYTTDWRKQYRAGALCVLRPASTAQVAAVVALCAREGIAFEGHGRTPSGGRAPAHPSRRGVRPEPPSLARVSSRAVRSQA